MVCVLSLLWLAGLPAAVAGEILVFAAASLTDALHEIARDYGKSTGEKIFFNFGASSTLARQIQEGARADIFISADEEKMDALQKHGLLKEGTRRVLLSNTLVIVVAAEDSFGLKTPTDLKNAQRVAVGEPSTVPAGIYARRYLEELGIWKSINILPTDNVRSALLAVESGNADAGILYRTDAMISKKVQIAYTFPENKRIRILYPGAVLKEGKNTEGAGNFLSHLGRPMSTEVFERHGFGVPAPEK